MIVILVSLSFGASTCHVRVVWERPRLRNSITDSLGSSTSSSLLACLNLASPLCLALHELRAVLPHLFHGKKSQLDAACCGNTMSAIQLPGFVAPVRWMFAENSIGFQQSRAVCFVQGLSWFGHIALGQLALSDVPSMGGRSCWFSCRSGVVIRAESSCALPLIS